MRDVHIMVEVELMRSDGNYGRDRAVCQMSAMVDADESPQRAVRDLINDATAQVELQLKHSASLEVRRTMLRKPRLCNHCGQPLADEDRWELHPACDELQREERAKKRAEEQERRAREWALSNANAEEHDLVQAGVRVGDEVEDEDDDDDDDEEDLPL